MAVRNIIEIQRRAEAADPFPELEGFPTYNMWLRLGLSECHCIFIHTAQCKHNIKKS